MNDPLQHSWDVDIAEAQNIQEQLRHRVIPEDDLGPVRLVAGVDVGFEEKGAVTRAAVAVLTLADLQLVESAVVRQPTTFPYIPGFLSFREIPALMAALAQLKIVPDLLLCDGQGIAHPRGLGIASHLGVLADMPTIGVGKSRLVGRHESVGVEKGSRQPLQYKGKIVGTVLRTRTNTKPLYISLGHRVSLETAVHYTLLCTPKYRLPETTRQAHRLASG